MKIAVVGAGIYGVTISVALAKEGFNISLFEKEKEIMMAASFVNQYRLHRGYHYPRSKETADSCLKSEKSFEKEYGPAIIKEFQHYYAVAKEKSLSSASDCLKVWKENGLFAEETNLSLINNDKVEKIFKTKEYLIDPYIWRKICQDNLQKYKIKTFLGKKFEKEDMDDFDFVIIASYSLNNMLLENDKMVDYQFELCEKPLFALPDKYKDKSIVIMDGPFMCIDPFGRTGNFLMGNVVHAIHHTNIGKFPHVPKGFENLLNKGFIKNPSITNVPLFLKSAEEFFPGISKEAKYLGSMFTHRTVLPNREHDDSRPTIVRRIGSKIISVFSGKIPVCVEAANEVLNLMKEERKKIELNVVNS